MKKLFLFLLIALVVGAWVGEKMVLDQGYALLAYNNTTVESSLWVLLTVLAVAFVILHWLVNIVVNTRIPTDRIRNWRRERNRRSSQRKTMQGLIALSEGNWYKAQKLLTQSAEDSDLPLVNYLSAARAAHEAGNDRLADELLSKAHKGSPNASVAVGIAQAEIQLARGQLEPCLANLLKLRQMAPRNNQITRLLKEVYVQLNDWQSITKLLPDLKKQHALQDGSLEALAKTSHIRLLEDSLQSMPAEAEVSSRVAALDKTWKSVPKDLSSDAELASRYTDLLVSLGAEQRAEESLRNMINQQWSDSLIILYGRLEGTDSKRQLEQASKWLKKQPDNASLLLTLGRLSLRNQNWDEALNHFEQSVEKETSAENVAELARLLSNLGRTSRADVLLSENPQAKAVKLPNLPQPTEEKAEAVS